MYLLSFLVRIKRNNYYISKKYLNQTFIKEKIKNLILTKKQYSYLTKFMYYYLI